MKENYGNLDATPSKRLYLSIIADYDTRIAICELIDNAIDNWSENDRKNKLNIDIILDYDRQLLKISDDSGGIREEDMRLIVSPGHSKNDGKNATIGTFGVGSKRAVIALGEDIKICSRYKREDTFLVEVDNEWIQDETWILPYYKTNNIKPNSTSIEIIKLRTQLLVDNEGLLRNHLGASYALLLDTDRFKISLNSINILPVFFDSWSYPPNHEPQSITGQIHFDNGGTVKFEILGGLTKSGDPAGGEYGAYFYCNNRLVSRAYKGYEVGYRATQIGQPHPSVSIARSIIKLFGPAELMPWNSSKSDISPKHVCFIKIQEHISRILTHYSTLAKKWSTGGGWETNVFQHATGVVIRQQLEDVTSRYLLPSIPRPTKQKYPDVIKNLNKELVSDKPWTRGLYEGIIAVNELPKIKLEQNNRFSLIILDSTLEIAFKDFLVYEMSISESRLSSLMENRSEVQKAVKSRTSFKKGTWDKIDYFYKLRCDLIHKRASANISDNDLKNFRSTVEYVLNKMFALNFAIDS